MSIYIIILSGLSIVLIFLLGLEAGIKLTDRKWMDNADFEESGIQINGRWYKVTEYLANQQGKRLDGDLPRERISS